MMRYVFLSLVLVVSGLAAGCDAGFDGSRTGNQEPDTELSVRSTDLREDLAGRRLLSTVTLGWSGTDPDGIIAAFEVRAYAIGAAFPAPSPTEGWSRTTRRDSTILLPIPLGQETADVAVEVRAIDNEGAVDATPARTVFPIVNSSPSFRLSAAEAPPDSTWPVISFAFSAADPDGEANLSAIEVALNDSTAFARLPADATFLTLVAEDPAAQTTGARVFVGRGFQNTGVVLPGLRLDADNVVYLRAVDAAGATSRLTTYPDVEASGILYVRRITSTVLLVNDLRVGAGTPDRRPIGVARAALALHGVATVDSWDLSATPLLVSSPRISEALPATSDPTLRQTLALWDRIYWVSNAVTNSPNGNNLPVASAVVDRFFERGGRMMVQTPITRPLSGDEGATNAAINIMPMLGLVSFAGGVRTLRVLSSSAVTAASAVPNTGGLSLPPLVASRLVTSALPYEVGPDDIPLYRVPFRATFTDQTSANWTGSEVVASIRSDGRVGLFALPLFDGGGALFAPATPGGPGVADALAILLDGLDFPNGRRPASSFAAR